MELDNYVPELEAADACPESTSRSVVVGQTSDAFASARVQLAMAASIGRRLENEEENPVGLFTEHYIDLDAYHAIL